MKLKIEISEGEVVPKGYGLAYRRYDCLKAIFYPIPLNIIIRIFKEIYLILMRGLFYSKYEGELLRARFKGFQEGKNLRLGISPLEKKKYIQKGIELAFKLFKFRNLDNKEYEKKLEELWDEALKKGEE